MCVNHKKDVIKSPGNIVLTGYAPCFNIEKKLHQILNILIQIIFIDLSDNKQRLGGSILLREFNKLGREAPQN